MESCFPCDMYTVQCDFCKKKIKDYKEYYFIIQGPGKHDDKVICMECLKYKLLCNN